MICDDREPTVIWCEDCGKNIWWVKGDLPLCDRCVTQRRIKRLAAERGQG